MLAIVIIIASQVRKNSGVWVRLQKRKEPEEAGEMIESNLRFALMLINRKITKGTSFLNIRASLYPKSED